MLAPALTGLLRYEGLMAARRRVVWFATVPLVALSVLLTATSPALNGLPTTAAQLAAWAVPINLLSTLGLGVALADRFVRSTRAGLPDLLDTTPAGPGVRMTAGLLGAVGVALAPVAVAFLLIGVGFAVTRGDPSAIGWALAALLVVIVPAALVTGTFAATLGLIVPVPLARALTVVVWIWATVWNRTLLRACQAICVSEVVHMRFTGRF